MQKQDEFILKPDINFFITSFMKIFTYVIGSTAKQHKINEMKKLQLLVIINLLERTSFFTLSMNINY